MANVGQIIYNIEDYNSSGGYISTSKNNIAQTVTSKDYNNFEDYLGHIIDIFDDNIVNKVVSGASFSNLGIQAPPGTRAIINGKKIMIGRTGVYETVEDIAVTSLVFERPKKYTLNVSLSDASLEEGIKGFAQAEAYREGAMAELDKDAEDYWEKYQEVQNEYNSKYQQALSKYNEGINGVYELPYPAEPDNPANYEVLYNIIIDYIY